MKPSYLDPKREKNLHIYWLLITQANPFPYKKPQYYLILTFLVFCGPKVSQLTQLKASSSGLPVVPI